MTRTTPRPPDSHGGTGGHQRKNPCVDDRPRTTSWSGSRPMTTDTNSSCDCYRSSRNGGGTGNTTGDNGGKRRNRRCTWVINGNRDLSSNHDRWRCRKGLHVGFGIGDGDGGGGPGRKWSSEGPSVVVASTEGWHLWSSASGKTVSVTTTSLPTVVTPLCSLPLTPPPTTRRRPGFSGGRPRTEETQTLYQKRGSSDSEDLPTP